MARFQDAIETILKHEGGYVNDPKDRGGATNFGVSDRADGKVDGLIDLDRDGIGDTAPKNLTRAQAIDYYRRFYWRSIYDGIIFQKLATKVFDFAVNMGHAAAHKMLQRALIKCGRPVPIDGNFGPVTLAAVNQVNGPALTAQLCAEAEARYRAIVSANPSQSKFLNGWLRRAYA